MDEGRDVTELLNRWSAGDEGAAEAALLESYERLRGMARSQLRGPADRQLQTTELVHEAYLRLHRLEDVRFQSREHFLAFAARIMRQILVDLARHRRRAKRDGGLRAGDSTLRCLPADSPPPDTILAVDRALSQLSTLDALGGRIVELRFFAGFSMLEVSRALRISESTAHRHWRDAKSWLLERLPRAA